MHSAGGDEIVGDIFRRVDGNSEADAGGGASGRINCAVDPDHFAARIDEWSAGVAAIDGGISLDCFFNRGALAGSYGAAERANHPRRECGLEAERISNRQDLLPNLKRIGVSKL